MISALQEFLLEQRAKQLNRTDSFNFSSIFMTILEVLEFIGVTLETIWYFNRKVYTINNYIYI